MKKIISLLFIFISLVFSNQAFSNDDLIQSLKEGGKIIFIRHAYAPGGGDPDNFDVNDCSTQRNLNNEGISQSKLIGEFFVKNKIQIDQVLSSEWCRCKDTAKYAFKNFKTFNALNSFFSSKFAQNEDKQIKDLKNFIQNWKSEKNLVLVTHYVVISSMLNMAVGSGEIVITNNDYDVIGTIETM
jgi:phosphohistidine phosphatase SixA|tara:strand:- start:839 stop:1393 length:555 start_codon:yes stop_codon:yes gene_type:complete